MTYLACELVASDLQIADLGMIRLRSCSGEPREDGSDRTTSLLDRGGKGALTWLSSGERDNGEESWYRKS